MSDASYSLLLAFDTDEAEFTRGFEAGMLWCELRATDGPVERTIHDTNVEMAIRLGEATKRPFTAEDVGYGWIHVRYGAVDDRLD